MSTKYTPKMFGKGQYKGLGKGLATVGRVQSSIGAIMGKIIGSIFILGGVAILIWGAVGPEVDCDQHFDAKCEDDKKPMSHGMKIGLIIGGIIMALLGVLIIWLSAVTKKIVKKNPDMAAILGGVGLAEMF